MVADRPDRGLADLVAGARAHALRLRGAAGLAGRPVGGPAGTVGALAHNRGRAGLHPDAAIAGAVAGDPGADDRAAGGHGDRIAAGIPRLVHADGAAVGGAADRAGTGRLAGRGPADRVGARPLAAGRWRGGHAVRLFLALGLRGDGVDRQPDAVADPDLLLPARLGPAGRTHRCAGAARPYRHGHPAGAGIQRGAGRLPARPPASCWA